MNQFCNMLAVFSWAQSGERENFILIQFHIPLHHFVPYPTGRGFYPLVQWEGFLVATGGPWGQEEVLSFLDYNLALFLRCTFKTATKVESMSWPTD